jgi:hypothetical protein
MLKKYARFAPMLSDSMQILEPFRVLRQRLAVILNICVFSAWV